LSPVEGSLRFLTEVICVACELRVVSIVGNDVAGISS
jgi:hypothetical protein